MYPVERCCLHLSKQSSAFLRRPQKFGARFWHYLVTSKPWRRLYQIFVVFLEKLNFMIPCWEGQGPSNLIFQRWSWLWFLFYTIGPAIKQGIYVPKPVQLIQWPIFCQDFAQVKNKQISFNIFWPKFFFVFVFLNLNWQTHIDVAS